MSSLSPKDRVSLCSFTFSDGRRCRTPRIRNHPHFCFDHAQKEARARATESLGKDLAYFFSGNYLSACDLSTAMGRLIPAVIRGDVKPKVARTVAYMAQTLLQSIHISQDEYSNAFGTEGWRKSIRNSVNGNHTHRFPPAPRSGGLQAGVASQPQHPTEPQPQPAATSSPACHPERSEGSQLIPATQNCAAAQAACPEGTRTGRPEESVSSSNSPLTTRHSFTPSEAETSLPPAPEPAPSPHTPLPPTSTEFVQHVLAGLPTGSLPATPHVQPAPHNPQLAETAPANCHSERSEESAFSSSPSSSPVCHPERSERSHPTPAAQSAPPTAPPAPPVNSPNLRSSTSPHEPNRDVPWLHFGDSRRVPPDSKLL